MRIYLTNNDCYLNAFWKQNDEEASARVGAIETITVNKQRLQLQPAKLYPSWHELTHITQGDRRRGNVCVENRV